MPADHDQDLADELADMKAADAGVTYPVSVNLSPFAKRVLDKLVNEQGYRTVEAAIEDAILRTEETDEWKAEVRDKIDRGIAQADAGQTVDGETFMRELIAKAEARAAAAKADTAGSSREAV